MKVVVSTMFRVLRFPHQGRIITIDQLNFCIPDFHSSTNVPFISESSLVIKAVGAYLYKDPCLMGIFPMHAPNTLNLTPINMISSTQSEYPWIILDLLEVDSFGGSMPLSLAKLSYSVI